ncbi:MAG TPA: hypothetical protein VG944_20960 [Fimbriimonas sp.]|nr:hypothetical protein [Fimbriimonas sp.]
MIKANIAEVKAHFSSYVRRAKAGEVIVVCERNVPIAELRPILEKPKKREFGFLEGAGSHIPDEAFAPMSEEELAEWYGCAVQDGPRIIGEVASRYRHRPLGARVPQTRITPGPPIDVRSVQRAIR